MIRNGDDLQGFEDLSESHGHNLAVTVLHVPDSLDSGGKLPLQTRRVALKISGDIVSALGAAVVECLRHQEHALYV